MNKNELDRPSWSDHLGHGSSFNLGIGYEGPKKTIEILEPICC